MMFLVILIAAFLIILIAGFAQENGGLGAGDFSVHDAFLGEPSWKKPNFQLEDKGEAFNSSYDEYYSELHDDAFSGDIDAREEMADEFGDEWEGEY